jgi:hypothetical protein
MMQQFLQDARENLPLELLWIILAFILINVVYEEIVKPRLDSHRKKRTVAHRRKKFEEQKRDFLMVHAFKTGKRDKVIETSVKTAELALVAPCMAASLTLALMSSVTRSIGSAYDIFVALVFSMFGAWFLSDAQEKLETLRRWRDMYENYGEWKKLFAEHGVNVDEVGEHRSLDDE